jgi:seryl-tRNA synthetase
MIDLNFVRNNPEKVREDVAKKNCDAGLVDRFLDLDAEWRKAKATVDGKRAEQKKLGEKEREKARELKKEIKDLEERLDKLEEERGRIIDQLPNLPAEDVPVGRDDSDNLVLREVGERPEFSFEPKDYFDLANGLINTEKAGRVAGSRFGYIFGDLVKLEFALVRLGFDIYASAGFLPVLPPVMVKPEIMKGMGKIKFLEADDAFYLPKDDLYLVGSSEHSIIPFHTDDLLNPADLPKRYMGFSTCFRREAGTYGKDMKGILRVHQFDKLELNCLTLPEESEAEHQRLLALQEKFMQTLGIPYRVMFISTGDMGFNDYKQYDVEAWFPGQNRYRETHSCSNTTDYQARGLNIRYRKSETENEFVHTLNATGFTFRAIISLLENNQTEDGRVVLPEALWDFMGTKEIGPWR